MHPLAKSRLRKIYMKTWLPDICQITIVFANFNCKIEVEQTLVPDPFLRDFQSLLILFIAFYSCIQFILKFCVVFFHSLLFNCFYCWQLEPKSFDFDK